MFLLYMFFLLFFFLFFLALTPMVVFLAFLFVFFTAANSTTVTSKSSELQQWNKCADQLSCTNCTTVSGCHWCASDKACHVYGSTYGCAIGLDCKDAEECVRKTSTWVGYQKPPPRTVVLWIILGLACLVLYFIPYFYLKQATSQRRSPQSYMLLQEIGPEEEEAEEKQKGRKCYKCCLWGLIPYVLLVASGVIFGIILWPTATPLYSACNTKIEWTSALQSLLKPQLAVDVDMHYALYNPNRLSAEVLQGSSITLLHKGDVVGSGLLPGFTLTGGSVTDVVMVLRLQPGLSHSLQMWAEHQIRSLVVDVHLNLHSDISFQDYSLLRVNTTYIIPKISSTAPQDRQFCKCP